MKYRIAFFAALLLICLSGCETLNSEEDYSSYPNALIIKPAQESRVNAGLLTKEGTVLYSFGSAFVGGGIADPNEGSSHRCHFYRESFMNAPNGPETEPIVYIEGFRHAGTDYTKPGQLIDRIYLLGLDESLGLGENLDIPLNQGKYEGGNKLIKDVRIDHYQFETDITTFLGEKNKEAKIDIVITSMAGDILIIHFANAAIRNDGYV